MTNDGLLGYSRAGGAQSFTVVPDLAVGLPTVSDGGRTYTFQLRRGIRYSTGRRWSRPTSAAASSAHC